MSILRYCINILVGKACYLASINKHISKYVQTATATCSYWQHKSDCVPCAVMFLRQPSKCCVLLYPWLCVPQVDCYRVHGLSCLKLLQVPLQNAVLNIM